MTEGTHVPIHELLHPLLVGHQGLVLVICQWGPGLAVNAADHVAHFRPIVLQLLRLPVRLCRDLSVKRHKDRGSGSVSTVLAIPYSTTAPPVHTQFLPHSIQLCCCCSWLVHPPWGPQLSTP